MKKQTLYFAVYVNVGGQSPQKARETLAKLNHLYTRTDAEQQYEDKFFFMPIKNGENRIELLYPTPFLTEEQAEKIHERYLENYQEIIKKIEEL